MRIDSNYQANAIGLYKTQQTQAGQTETKEEVTGDTLQLSDQAQKIHDLIQETKELPEVREEKINQIKEEISNNTYQVTTQQLANKMLSSENE